MRTHLKILGTDIGALYNPESHDFRWNRDFTAFRAVACRWSDDASYAAYQAEDCEE